MASVGLGKWEKWYEKYIDVLRGMEKNHCKMGIWNMEMGEEEKQMFFGCLQIKKLEVEKELDLQKQSILNK